uniref:Phage protein n=1 Tax=Syphacia muris TaxID=451379 RepID=A0A0N5A976_9BILA
MKRLKRRISAAFKANDTSSAVPVRFDRNWSLSDSMSELAERLAAEGMIIEECDPQVEQKRSGYKHSSALYVSRGHHDNYDRNCVNGGAFCGRSYMQHQRHPYYAPNESFPF